MKYRFQHFHTFTHGQLWDLIEDASSRGQIVEHKKRGWILVVEHTVAVSMCTIEDDDRNVLGRGYVFLRKADANTPKEIRRRITKGRADMNMAGGRKAYSAMKSAIRRSLKTQLSKMREDPHAAIY